MIHATGATRAVVEGALNALRDRVAATLAVVVETSGSTYVRCGAIALFAPNAQTGWLSGGCLEPEIARKAQCAAENASVEWMEIDTRDDEDLFAGSAVGCRGRLRLALLPILSMNGWEMLADAWIAGEGVLEFSVDISGQLECKIADHSHSWALSSRFSGWQDDDNKNTCWSTQLPVPPSVVIFGAGPEIPLLVPLLRALGWMTTIAESRTRWLSNTELADHQIAERPESAIKAIEYRLIHAALVMHHNFELDREALQVLARTGIAFIGLLGPKRRRDDLFKVLPAEVREALLPRLYAPIGLDLGGHGPEAIAISIAAQLQAFMHRK